MLAFLPPEQVNVYLVKFKRRQITSANMQTLPDCRALLTALPSWLPRPPARTALLATPLSWPPCLPNHPALLTAPTFWCSWLGSPGKFSPPHFLEKFLFLKILAHFTSVFIYWPLFLDLGLSEAQDDDLTPIICSSLHDYWHRISYQ